MNNTTTTPCLAESLALAAQLRRTTATPDPATPATPTKENDHDEPTQPDQPAAA